MRRLIAAILLAALSMTGCGGAQKDDSRPAPSPTSTLALPAGDSNELRAATEYRATLGSFGLTFRLPSPGDPFTGSRWFGGTVSDDALGVRPARGPTEEQGFGSGIDVVTGPGAVDGVIAALKDNPGMRWTAATKVSVDGHAALRFEGTAERDVVFEKPAFVEGAAPPKGERAVFVVMQATAEEVALFRAWVAPDASGTADGRFEALEAALDHILGSIRIAS